MVVPLGAQGVAEEVDGVTLEAKSDVCVGGRDYPDADVAEKLLDDDEFDALPRRSVAVECRRSRGTGSAARAPAAR
jgi:hypothetical protein